MNTIGCTEMLNRWYIKDDASVTFLEDKDVNEGVTSPIFIKRSSPMIGLGIAKEDTKCSIFYLFMYICKSP